MKVENKTVELILTAHTSARYAERMKSIESQHIKNNRVDVERVKKELIRIGIWYYEEKSDQYLCNVNNLKVYIAKLEKDKLTIVTMYRYCKSFKGRLLKSDRIDFTFI